MVEQLPFKETVAGSNPAGRTKNKTSDTSLLAKNVRTRYGSSMKKKQTIWIWVLVLIVIVGGLIGLLVHEGKKPGKYDQLAQCITDSGAKFYGTFWCPHCQAQKAMFGKSAKKLPYIECSTKDAKGQTQICIDNNIQSYPTWELADGTRLQVESTAGVSLKTLAEKTNCPVPTE